MKCLHVQASLCQIALWHGTAFLLSAAIRQKPFMTHSGYFDIQFPCSVQKSCMLLHRTRIWRQRIPQNFRNVHPGAECIATHSPHQIQTGIRPDPAVSFPLHQGLPGTKKALSIHILITSVIR